MNALENRRRLEFRGLLGPTWPCLFFVDLGRWKTTLYHIKREERALGSASAIAHGRPYVQRIWTKEIWEPIEIL